MGRNSFLGLPVLYHLFKICSKSGTSHLISAFPFALSFAFSFFILFVFFLFLVLLALLSFFLLPSIFVL